jgi:hypothetical protein
MLNGGKPVSEKGSSFTASVARVKTQHEARLAYRKLLLDSIKAGVSHTVAVYRLSSPYSPGHMDEGWQDDGEHGAGRQVCVYIYIYILDSLDFR